MQCVYLFYPVLKQHVQYQFEPCDGDTIDHITADHGGVVTILSQEAIRWATRIIRETNNIKENTRKLQVFQALRESGQKVKTHTYSLYSKTSPDGHFPIAYVCFGTGSF